MNMKTLTIAAALIGTALVCAAQAQTKAQNPANAVNAKDQEFMTEAALGGLYEVQAGTLAQQKARTPAIQSYGSMLVQDHGAANAELKTLAARKGVALPTELRADKTKKLEKISNAKDFEAEFVKEVGLNDHQTDIALFEKASRDAKDPDVKAFAAKTLPTLKAHREHAEGLKKVAQRQ